MSTINLFREGGRKGGKLSSLPLFHYNAFPYTWLRFSFSFQLSLPPSLPVTVPLSSIASLSLSVCFSTSPFLVVFQKRPSKNSPRWEGTLLKSQAGLQGASLVSRGFWRSQGRESSAALIVLWLETHVGMRDMLPQRCSSFPEL